MYSSIERQTSPALRRLLLVQVIVVVVAAGARRQSNQLIPVIFSHQQRKYQLGIALHTEMVLCCPAGWQCWHKLFAPPPQRRISLFLWTKNMPKLRGPVMHAMLLSRALWSATAHAPCYATLRMSKRRWTTIVHEATTERRNSCIVAPWVCSVLDALCRDTLPLL